MHKNMHYKNLIIDIFAVTFRKEGVDWNNLSLPKVCRMRASPSARKVWIEIINSIPFSCKTSVTFRKEGVDWNWKYRAVRSGADVTFRKEGVDWNP